MNWKPLALFTALLVPGCIVYEDGHSKHGGDVVIDTNVNYSPEVYWADAGCYWDDYNYDRPFPVRNPDFKGNR